MRGILGDAGPGQSTLNTDPGPFPSWTEHTHTTLKHTFSEGSFFLIKLGLKEITYVLNKNEIFIGINRYIAYVFF